MNYYRTSITKEKYIAIIIINEVNLLLNIVLTIGLNYQKKKKKFF